MEADTTEKDIKSNPCAGFRAFAPLSFCLIFVGMLIAHQLHIKLSKSTRLRFAAYLEGETDTPQATVDGRPIEAGGVISIGFRNLVVEHPKGKTFSTNLFVWYGGQDLGNIILPRNKGELTLSANPPAPSLRVEGQGLNFEFRDLTQTNLILPTGDYLVEVEYPNWQKRGKVTVSGRLFPESVSFRPPVGSLKLTSTASNVRYELVAANGSGVASGTLPAYVHHILAGDYNFIAQDRAGKREMNAVVKTHSTNEYQIDFKYGAASIETDPPGASVLTEDGREWGRTPLTLTDLEPGPWEFALRREGYQTIRASLEVVTAKTNTFRAGFVHSNYAAGVEAARRYLEAGEYAKAREAALAALRVKSDDPTAKFLKERASGLENLRLAKEFAQRDDFTAAINALQRSLEEWRDNGEATRLMNEYQEGAKSQAKRKHEDWLTRGRTLFRGILLKDFQGEDLFESHELKVNKSLGEVEKAIIHELQAGDPVFEVKSPTSPERDSFIIRAFYEMPLSSIRSGRRYVVFVGTRMEENETELLYKVLEYKLDSKTSTFGRPVYLPIHPSWMGGSLPSRFSNQINEGIADIKARIQRSLVEK